MVCLDMGLEDGADRGAEPLGLVEVAGDQVDVRVEDCKLAVREAAEHVARAGGRREQERSQNHRLPQRYDSP